VIFKAKKEGLPLRVTALCRICYKRLNTLSRTWASSFKFCHLWLCSRSNALNPCLWSAAVIA